MINKPKSNIKNTRILKPIQHQKSIILNLNLPILIHKPLAKVIAYKTTQYKVNNFTKINFDFAIVEQVVQMFTRKYRSGNPYMLFARSIFNSDYEWYLHKNMLKEMYTTYQQITSLTKKHKKLNLSVFDLYMYPNLIIKKDYYSETQYGDSVSNDFSSNSQFDIQKKIKLEHYDENDYTNKASKIQNTVYSSVNLDSIMNHIYKNLEERLRYERLKKGV